MPLIDEIANFWNMRSEGFSDAVVDEFFNKQSQLKSRLTEQLGITKDSRILDIGCGPGFFEFMFSDVCAEITGIDYSAGMVEQAVANSEKYSFDARFLSMDAQNLGFSDESFDIILSRNVLWCLDDPGKAYSEMMRVMKPGAGAYIFDGNYYHPETVAAREKAVRRVNSSDAGDHRKFNKGQVDFNIISDLASNLSITQEARPQWDFATLCDLGAAGISVTNHYLRDEAGQRLGIGAFEIIFRKE